MSDVKNWVENSAYSQALGVSADTISEETASLSLPFREENSNPGALHGGVYASLSVIGAHAVARTILGEEIGPFHTVGFQINYLSAALEEGVKSESKMLRRGKELCFVESSVFSESGKHLTHATLMIRGRQGADESVGPQTLGDDGFADSGVMGPIVTDAVPFIKSRGMQIENMSEGQSRIVMPWKDTHADIVTGGTHEGAALALLDTAGAMAGWAVTGAGPYKASTPSMQAQILATPPKGDLVAYAKVRHQDNEIFYSDAEVASVETGQVCAKGTVLYRIKT